MDQKLYFRSNDDYVARRFMAWFIMEFCSMGVHAWAFADCTSDFE